MKRKNTPKGSITKPLLQDLTDSKKANVKPSIPGPVVVKSPAKQPVRPALYEDAGGGFNSDSTFPQE